MPFNVSKIHNKLAEEISAGLIFTCTICERQTHKRLKSCLCGSSIFKVARSMPLINYPLDPYRNKTNEDSGEYLTNAGDINSSIGGAEVVDFPQDGSGGEGGDEVGTPNAKSDDMTQSGPMKDVNRRKSDYGVGAHTMNSVMPTSSPNPSVFNRTKSKLQYNFTQGR